MLSKKELGKYLKDVRESLGYSTDDVNKLCEISQSYISLMESGKRKPSAIILKKLAPIYSLDYMDLYEKAGYLDLIDIKKDDNLEKGSHIYNVPYYGKISAGTPNWAEECLEGYLPIDPELMHILNPEEYFFLRVNGESMNEIVKNGAYALIHKQDVVNDGEIAVVLVNGDEATIKEFSKKNDIVVLTPHSDDNSFKQQIYDKNTPIRVIGKYVGKLEIN